MGVPQAPAGFTLYRADEYAARLKAMDPAEREKQLRRPVFFVLSSHRGAQFEDVNVRTVQAKAPPRELLLAKGAVQESLLMPLVPNRLNPATDHLTVGRAPLCDLVLPLPGISKVHAFLHDVGPDGCEVEDAGSTNGTFVAGVRLQPKERRPLVNHSRVVLAGEVVLEFCSASRVREELFPET